MIALFGGAAGSGKTTVARLWCERQPRAVHIELDEVRELIVSGREDPQVTSVEQARQYELSVRACCALARSFADGGFSVALGDVFEPESTRTLWAPELVGYDVRIVILHPTLDAALAREAGRRKGVLERHIRSQHRAAAEWPRGLRIDSTEQSPTQTLEHADRIFVTSRLVDLLHDGV